MTTQIQEYNPYVAQGKLLSTEIESFEIRDFSDLTKADELLKRCQSVKKEIEEKRKEMVKPMNEHVKQVNNLAKEVLIPVEEAEISIKSKILERNKEQEKIRMAKENAVKEAIERIQKCFIIADIDAMTFEVSDARIDSAKLIQRGEIQRRINAENEKKIREAEEARLAAISKQQDSEAARLEAENIELDRKKREFEASKQQIENEKQQYELSQNKTPDATVKAKWVRKLLKFEIVDADLVHRSLCSPDEKKIREYVKNWVKEIPGVRVREEDAVR